MMVRHNPFIKNILCLAVRAWAVLFLSVTLSPAADLPMTATSLFAGLSTEISELDDIRSAPVHIQFPVSGQSLKLLVDFPEYPVSVNLYLGIRQGVEPLMYLSPAGDLTETPFPFRQKQHTALTDIQYSIPLLTPAESEVTLFWVITRPNGGNLMQSYQEKAYSLTYYRIAIQGPTDLKSIAQPLCANALQPPPAPEATLGDGAANGTAMPEASVYTRGRLWENGTVIPVAFDFTGTHVKDFAPFLCQESDSGETCANKIQLKFLEAARNWSYYGNIHFELKEWYDAQARIQFNPKAGNYTKVIGTDLLQIPAYQHTMNFDPRSLTHTTDFNRTVIHEFGHVIGLAHEHQNPTKRFEWNEDAIYQYCESHWNWDQATIYHNIIKYLSDDYAQYDPMPFDADSIMVYPILKSWVRNTAICPSTDPLYCILPTQVLSPQDKTGIAALYPYPEDTYQSRYEMLRWPRRGTDPYYCIDLCDTNYNVYEGLRALKCGEHLLMFSPRDFLKDLGLPDLPVGVAFNWRIWSSSGYGGEGFEGKVVVEGD